MNCRELIELMIDYVEGELPEEMCVHIREHIEHCGPCGHFYHSYEITIRVTGKLPQAPMPASLHEKLKSMLKNL